MKFIDEAKIFVQSGHGGPGAVSFRREKFVPRGGPDGGSGGRGGNIVFQVSDRKGTLLDFKFKTKFIAENGHKGEGQNMTGHNGQDVIIDVPVGTILRDNAGEIIVDLNESGSTFTLLKGGRGGRGNQFFKNSINQAPRHAQPGEEGEQANISLELKVLADVGIIGFPNAGKSTLISRVSQAKPKIADYPFTTLVPNLGVVQGPDFKSFVVADIPGLVKDAHKGTGLGIKFLKHIERTRFFIHLVDASEFSGRDPVEDFDDINYELAEYDRMNQGKDGFVGLSDRPQIVGLNKVDLLEANEVEELKAQFENKGFKVIALSSATGQGVKELMDYTMGKLSE